MPEGVQARRAVCAAPDAWCPAKEAEREDLLSEVSPVETPPEDRLVHRLELADGEASGEEPVHEVRVAELRAEPRQRGADDRGVVVRQPRKTGDWPPRRVAGQAAAPVRDQRDVRDRDDTPVRIALGAPERVQLLQIYPAYRGLYVEMPPRRRLERLVRAHPPARQGRPSGKRAVPHRHEQH